MNQNQEPNDPVLDVCLAELLGGQTPPDLSDKILAAWLQHRNSPVQPAAAAPPASATRPVVSPAPISAHIDAALSNGHANGVHADHTHVTGGLTPVSLGTPPGVRPEAPASPPVAMPLAVPAAPARVSTPAAELPLPAVAPAAAYRPARRRGRNALRWLAVAASLLVAVVGYAAVKNQNMSQWVGNVVAKINNTPAEKDLASPTVGGPANATAPDKSVVVNEGITPEGMAEYEREVEAIRAKEAEDALKRKQAAVPSNQPEIRVDSNPAIPFPASSTQPKDNSPTRTEGGNVAGSGNATSSSDTDVITYINELIRKQWAAAGVEPSAVASDHEWIRRVFLDILGRIPTAEETVRFSADKSKDKRARLVDRLLDSDDYIEEYARNWTTIWTNILIGRNGGTEQNSMVSREGLQQYLRRAMLANKPYSDMVRDLVSAKGSNSPGAEDFNGATNFILHNLNEMATPATAKTAKIFLGVAVQCTQCHNHPFNDWKQDRFWQFNSFFRQARGVRTQMADNRNSARLEDIDFFGEGNKDPQEAEIYYELRNGLLKVAYPVFIDGTPISPSGMVAEVNRREELAKLIVRSPSMPQAMVNRMWAHFLGYGFTKPVDDMGPHNAASHPELLERLGQDFAGHGFDTKQLIRWITLCEAYSLSSRVTAKNSKDDPAMGERPLFSHFYLRQMRAEELYQSLIVATGAERTGGGDYAAQERRKADWLRQFTIAFGTDEGDETTTFNGTIPQTLMMWNGELVNNAISGNQGTYLHQVASSNSQPAKKLNQLFLTALSRNATNKEIQIANAAWVARKGDALGALQDVWWVVLNTNEFIFNH